MNEFKIVTLSNGVEGGFIKTEKFKTSILSFSFYIPHSEKAADFALLSEIITNVSSEFPTIRELKHKLDELYGAYLTTKADKVGDMLRIEFTLNFIDDNFTLNNEIISTDAAKLLISLLFKPSVTNGSFNTQDIERDRRVMKDTILSEINDKRKFAFGKAISIMCENEPFGLPRYGTVEQMENVTNNGLITAWQYLLENAFVRVNFIGQNYPKDTFDYISECFSNIPRDVEKKLLSQKHKYSTSKNERMTVDVNQSKLFLGFTFDSGNDILSQYIMKMFTVIFSGGTFSKCFKVVREKMSLCYYCAPTLIHPKGIVFVDLGIDIENCEKAKTAILEQLSAIQNGDITDDEFDAAILMLKSGLKEVTDSPDLLLTWLKNNTFRDEKYNSITEHEAVIEKLTKEQIIEVSKTVKLDTTFLLSSPQEVAE